MKDFLNWLGQGDNGFGFTVFCLFVGLPVFFGLGYFFLRMVEIAFHH